MFKTLILIFVISISALQVHAQVSPGWYNYTNSDAIWSITSDQSNLWVALRGGVIRYNISTQAITKYTVKDGLTENEVSGIAVAPNGNVYSSGSHSCGISRFDGTSWTKIFPLGSPPPLEMSNPAIICDSVGNVYTGGYRVVNSTWTYLTGICAGGVNLKALAIDSTNNIWNVGTDICKYNGSTFTTYDTSNSGILCNSGEAACVDKLGRIWISHNGGPKLGMSLYNPQTNLWQTFDTNFVKGFVQGLTVDNNNNLWAVMYPFRGSNSIVRYNGTTWTYFDSTSVPILSTEKFLKCIYFNPYDSALYIGTTPYGLCSSNYYYNGGGKIIKYKNSQWSSLDIGTNDIPSWDVMALTKDINNRIVVGSVLGGVSILDNTQWIYYNPLNSPMSNPYVRDLAMTSNLSLWVLTNGYSYGGGGCSGLVDPTLYRLYNNTWTTYNSNQILTDSIRVNSVRNCYSENNNVWFGTTGKTIKSDGTNWTKYDTLKIIKRITRDINGNLWFLSDISVTKYDGIGFYVYDFTNSPLPGGGLTDIDADTVGNIWILSSNTKQVFKFNGTTWASGTNNTTCGYGSNMQCLAANKGGDYVWVGLQGCGVWKTDLLTWTQLTTRTSGLNYNYVGRIIVDRNNNKYFLTQNLSGFSVYNENGLVNVSNSNQEILYNFSLTQNYPNPFNPNTSIRFSLPKRSKVELTIYDILGKTVVTLINEELSEGTHSADFDGSNYSSGVYFYKLTARDYSETKKMILIK